MTLESLAKDLRVEEECCMQKNKDSQVKEDENSKDSTQSVGMVEVGQSSKFNNKTVSKSIQQKKEEERQVLPL